MADPLAGMQRIADMVAHGARRGEVPRGMWGVVTEATPTVQVVLDGDTSATPRPVSGSDIGPVQPGWRVRLSKTGARLTITASPDAVVTSGDSRWTRWPDGTQICYLATTRTDIAVTSSYGVLYLGVWKWTFPLPFTAAPAVSCGRAQHGTSASWGGVATVTSSYADLRIYDAYSRASGTAVEISAVAVGRWL